MTTTSASTIIPGLSTHTSLCSTVCHGVSPIKMVGQGWPRDCLSLGYSRVSTGGADLQPRSIPKTNWPWLPPGHTTSGAVRTGECNHEMPGLPYPAFRRVDAEPGGGPSFDGSSYGERLGGHRCPGHRGLYPFEPQRGDLPQPRPLAHKR